jgi:hypothetical protein
VKRELDKAENVDPTLHSHCALIANFQLLPRLRRPNTKHAETINTAKFVLGKDKQTWCSLSSSVDQLISIYCSLVLYASKLKLCLVHPCAV